MFGIEKASAKFGGEKKNTFMEIFNKDVLE